MKKLIGVIVLSLLLIQCSSDKNTKIVKNQLGTINKNTSVEELDKLFSNDSVVKYPEGEDVFRDYRVYDKQGRELITIKFDINRDSIKGIELVKIFSEIYETEMGISTASTFKDILDNYSISKIEPTINSVIIFIDEINATLVLDKKDLKLKEYDMGKISQDQIPDMAPIKYINLWFE
jgi:uncharacterized protein YcfL